LRGHGGAGGHARTRCFGKKPDGIFLPNGPGDPAAVSYAVEAAAELCQSGKPIFRHLPGPPDPWGSHWGGKTYKLKFGHHGANHPGDGPVLRARWKSPPQNHGFAVDVGSLQGKAGACRTST